MPLRYHNFAFSQLKFYLSGFKMPLVASYCPLDNNKRQLYTHHQKHFIISTLTSCQKEGKMKTISKKFDVYSFKELSQQAKDKAINEQVRFYLECLNYEEMSPNMQKAVDKAEAMQTPWFAGEYIWEYAKEDILQVLNDSEFLKNGTLFI